MRQMISSPGRAQLRIHDRLWCGPNLGAELNGLSRTPELPLPDPG